MSAVRQAHGEDRLTRLHECAVGGEVGTRATVRLKVGVIGTEELLGALDPDEFRFVDLRAAAVIALARVPLGVLVAQCGTQGSKHGRRGEILTRNQLQAISGSVQLRQQDPGDVGIFTLQLAEVRPPELISAHRGLPPTARPAAGPRRFPAVV